MIEYIAIYFGVNLALALVIWLALLPTRISPIGYFLMMLFLGVIIVAALLIAFVILLAAGATYNLGDIIEKFFANGKLG